MRIKIKRVNSVLSDLLINIWERLKSELSKTIEMFIKSFNLINNYQYF
jgi:hypothetical protein